MIINGRDTRQNKTTQKDLSYYQSLTPKNQETTEERMKSLWKQDSASTAAVSATNSAVNKSEKTTKPSDLLKRVTVVDNQTLQKTMQVSDLEKQIKQKEDEYVKANNAKSWSEGIQAKAKISQELSAMRNELSSKKAELNTHKNDRILTRAQVDEYNKNAPLSQKIDKAIKNDIPVAAEKAVRTGADLVGNVSTGAIRGLEGYFDAGIGIGGTVLSGATNLVGQKELAKNIKDKAESIVKYGFANDMQKLVDEVSNEGAGIYKPSIFGMDMRDAAQEIARMYTVAYTGGLPGLMISAAGGNIEEALNEGQSLERATAYGAISGSIEGATEKMFDAANILGGGTIKKFANTFFGKIAEATAGEGIEEGLSQALNPFIKMLTYEGEVENPFGSWENFKNYLRDIGTAMSQGAIIGGLTLGVSAPGNVELQKSFSNDVYKAVDKIQGIDQVKKNEIASTILEGVKSVTGEDIKNIRKYVDNYRNTSEFSQYIPQNSNLAMQRENVTGLSKLNVQNQGHTQNIQQDNVTLPTQAEMAQRANMEQIPKNVQLPTQKAEITLQSAKVAGANDINMNKAIELNDLLRSGAEVKFYNPQNIPQGVDANKAKVANGFYSNGTVWINKNTKNAVEVVLGHELTHHLEQTNSYADLANTILDSDVFYEYITEKGYSNVDEYKQSLGQNYTAEQFDSEMVANFVQDKLFSDQDSINRLARQNTKLVEKIKNWLSDLIVSLRGTAQEKELRKIENMYRKALEEARNANITTESNIKYDVKRNSNDKPYVEITNNILENIPKSQWVNKVKEVFKNKFPDGIDMGFFDVAINAKSRNEFVNSEYTRNLKTRDSDLYAQKMKMVENLDEIVKNAYNVKNEDPKHPRKDNLRSFNRGNIDVKIGNNDYTIEVVTAVTSNNNEIFYDIVGIKPTKIETSSIRRTAETDSKIEDVSNNSIPQNENAVNVEYSLNNKNDTADGQSAFSLPEIKQKQLEIIQKSNPVNDDYHTWVRDVSDIKTFEEALQDSDYEGWENGDFAPDYTGEMAKQALKSGKVTVYSSYPIEQGVFVTPSKMEAKSYAGSGGFYSKTVDLRDVAWIDPTQGQYAKVTETDKVSFSLPDTDNQGRKLTKEQQEFFKDSKVRDENGKLQVVYHGTNSRKEISTYNPKTRMYDTTSEKFNVFKISTEFDTFGAFFADDYDNAGGYGSTVYEVYLNLTNPLVIDCKGRNYAAIEYNGDVMDTYDWAKWANKKGYDGVIFKNIYDGVGYEYMNKPVTEYVAFKANQVKEVTNTNPTSHPDIRYSMNPVDIAKNPPNPQNGLLEEIAPINEKELENVEEKEHVASVLTRSPKRPAKDLLKQSKDVFMRKIVDAGHTIDTVGKLTGDKHLYEYFNNTKQARQSAEYMIGEAQTDIRGNRVGNSLIRIFESVRAKGDDYTNKFFEYLLHMHNIDRMAQNKPVFGKSVTAEDSSRYVKELLEKYPEFEKQANKVYAYNRNLMQWRVDSGLISQEQADLMNQMYPHYVPTFRDVSGTSGSRTMQNTVQIANTVRKATGSDKDIMPIDASMARQTMQTVQAAKRNLLGNRLLNDVLNNKDKVGEYVQAVEKVNERNDLETELETPKDTNLESNNNVFKIFRNGETYVMKVNNGIYEGLKSISSEIDNTDTNLLIKPVKAANNTFKKLITGYSPMFSVKNFSRDIQDAGLYAKELRGFLKKYPNTYKEMMGNGKMWQLYKSLGGTGSSFFDYETGIEKTLDSRNKASTKIKEATVGKVEELNMMIEQAPRFAEFMATIEKAGNQNYDTLMEAMLNAADITVNFGRSGTWGKALNSTFVPFFNPSIQGFDKYARTVIESGAGKQFAKLAVRATLLGILPSVINELLYWDDDEYENLTDREKDTNFLIKVGDNKWLKIPKGRVLSIFGNTAARGLRTLKGEEWDFGEYAKNQASQTAPISVFDSNLYSPIQAVQNNKTWYGSDIVPQRLQDYAPKDQYDENTDIFSKWLGSKINYSPKKINYLIDAYTGIIGDVVLPLTTPKAETNPFTKAFVLDGVSSNEISNDFYKMMDKYNTKQNPKKSAKEVSRYLNKQSKQVSDIFKQIREIENSEISDAEKRKQVRELRELANTIELTAMAIVPEYEKAVDKYRGTFSDEDVDSEYAYLYANRDIFGSEYAVKTFSKALYNNHKKENMDKFFKSYFDKQYFQKKIEPEKSKGNALPTLAEQRAKLPSLKK